MNNCYPFYNTALLYSYSALEPYIDEETMKLHHDKHLQKYIDNLNSALLECPQLQNKNIIQLLSGCFSIKDDIRTKIRRNAGGVFNHRFFFEGMTPCSEFIDGRLEHTIKRCFGSIGHFKQQFVSAATEIYGSGYVWLVSNGSYIKIITTANQSAAPEMCYNPVLCLDMWEHAYYLKYQNRKNEYAENWFNVIDWKIAEERFCRSWQQ